MTYLPTNCDSSRLFSCRMLLLAYMAINIDCDDNKAHVLIEQRFMNCAFIIRKWCYGIKAFWTKMKVF